MNIVRKFQEAIKDLGWLDGTLYILSTLMEKFPGGRVELFKYYFVSQPVNPEPLLKHSLKRKIRVGPVSRESELILSFPRPQDVIYGRFAQQSICHAATRDDKFIGYIWFNEGPYFEDEVRCKYIPAPEGRVAWDYDVYIDPSSRLSLAFPMLWDSVNQRLYANGYRWCASRISAFNANSLAVHAKLGARKTGSATFLCIGKLQLIVSGLPPYLSVSIAAIPEIKVPSGDESR